MLEGMVNAQIIRLVGAGGDGGVRPQNLFFTMS